MKPRGLQSRMNFDNSDLRVDKWTTSSASSRLVHTPKMATEVPPNETKEDRKARKAAMKQVSTSLLSQSNSFVDSIFRLSTSEAMRPRRVPNGRTILQPVKQIMPK